MPLFLDTVQFGSGGEISAAQCVTVGLVNNMPDAALEATERQFTDLIRASARHTAVRVTLFSIPQVPRAAATRRDMAARYRDIGEMWDMHLDGLIVTGTEPKSRKLKDEPYWNALVQVIDWARQNTNSTLWSCLAAHAAVLHSDGIERIPFSEKLSGVFDCAPAGAHPMLHAVKLPMRVPHSRGNDLPERTLKAAGYRILTRSATAGVDMFVRQERSFHLFLQGHPEYGADTLLREYRRDIGRFLRRERERYPKVPRGYFDEKAKAVIDAFGKRALAERHPDVLKNFPLRRLEAGLAGGWRASAVAIYENWLDYLKGRKAERRSPLVPRRRTWRDWPPRGAPRAADGPVT
ncbi:MAG: homoserine O-succinyltransferase MetA [Xanthobacteraceae bacterium]